MTAMNQPAAETSLSHAVVRPMMPSPSAAMSTAEVIAATARIVSALAALSRSEAVSQVT